MNERRRTLLFSGGYEIPTAVGVYIETINHKFYTVDEWDTSNNANVNSVAVITQYAPEAHTENYRFRISNVQYASLPIDDTNSIRYETVLTAPKSARSDFSGKSNTEKMVSLNPSTERAAGYCNAFIFPDGTTKGYLPSCGELVAVNEMINEIDNAFNAFGGYTFGENTYSTSTFYGLKQIGLDTFTCMFAVQPVIGYDITEEYVQANYAPPVRPFGALE